jgi:poly-beta-1,6-N-acetyl-D-glucosamine synthase
MILVAGIITALYVFLILFLLFGIHKLAPAPDLNPVPEKGFSIVVPFRNEAEQLPQLLASFSKLNYPKHLFEIFLVNDASEDASEAICAEFIEKHQDLSIILLQNEVKSGSPKKDAVSKAISRCGFDHIVTTDADCVVPENWLNLFNSQLVSTRAALVAAPVMLSRQKGTNSLLHRFQEIDFLSLQAATMGSFGVQLPLMCNAANLCYSKKAFVEVSGFDGNEEFAGGDDMFLLEKFEAADHVVSYLNSEAATVLTAAQPSYGALFDQRIRWAGKSAAYKHFFSRFTGIVVLLLNLLTAIMILAAAIGLLEIQVFLFLFLLKFNVDFMLIYSSAKFFNRERIMKSYLWCSLIYPFFSSAVAISSLFCGFNYRTSNAAPKNYNYYRSPIFCGSSLCTGYLYY